MFSLVEQEKSFITSGPGVSNFRLGSFGLTGQKMNCMKT